MEQSQSRQLINQLAVQQVCSAENALQAHNCFKKNLTFLEDWQVIYADKSDVGSMKLLDLSLGNSGVATSIFAGRSLWIMDAPFVRTEKSAQVKFHCGSALFIDSNVATYIRGIAYQPKPSQSALNAASLINKLGPRLQHLNPFLYLWEAQRFWSAETASRCKESVAAIHALSSSGSRLTSEWGERYRQVFRDQAEAFAEGLVNEFEKDLKNGLSEAIADHLTLIEAVLVRTQLIELSSNKSKEHKLASLVSYMHNDISTIMLRELIVCGDILLRSNNSRIAKKLNPLQNQPDPASLLKNCAWDIFIPRILDALSAATPDQTPYLDYYLAEVLTLDGDVRDILHTTKLRAIAIHRPTKSNYPFFENNVAEWLGNRVGAKRMTDIENHFQPDSFITRENRRSKDTIDFILTEDRDKLFQLIKKKSR